jgi:hypothetical protein
VLALQHQAAEGDLTKRQEEIKNLVKPIEESIKAVSDATREMDATRATAFGTIEEQLRQSVASAVEVARQAGALKDALKKPNVRGRWGEVQLKICVELAGMEEHCDVEFQKTSLSAEDEALKPDMIVRMPGGKKITVDAKTPMVHFLSYIDASTDDERQTALLNHSRVVKKHVGDLAKTDYMQRIAESPDFVVMCRSNGLRLATEAGACDSREMGLGSSRRPAAAVIREQEPGLTRGSRPRGRSFAVISEDRSLPTSHRRSDYQVSHKPTGQLRTTLRLDVRTPRRRGVQRALDERSLSTKAY